MIKRFTSILLAFGLVLSTGFTGCSKSSNNQPASSSKAMPKFLTIGTAASGGAYYPIGIAIADIATNSLKVQATAQVTGGAQENNNLVEKKDVDLAITTSAMAYAAYNGKAPYNSQSKNVLAMFNSLSSGIFHVVVMNNSNINSMADLKGKRVNMGPAGGGAINMAKEIWGEFGFGIEDVKSTYSSYNDAVDSLKDGNVDAVVIQSAAPASAIKQLAATTKNFKLVSIDDAMLKKITTKYPYYFQKQIAKSEYETASDAMVISGSNLVVVNKTLSDDFVYNLTKALFENINKIKESNPTAKELSLEEAAKNLPIPMHPGAEKYFKEKGVLK